MAFLLQQPEQTKATGKESGVSVFKAKALSGYYDLTPKAGLRYITTTHFDLQLRKPDPVKTSPD